MPSVVTRVFLIACLMATPAFAHDYRVGDLLIGHPWARPAAAGLPMGVAYLSISNLGGTADALIGATTPVAASVQFHRTSVEGGIARMRPLTEVPLSPAPP